MQVANRQAGNLSYAFRSVPGDEGLEFVEARGVPVSYTHLTLPTSDLV